MFNFFNKNQNNIYDNSSILILVSFQHNKLGKDIIMSYLNEFDSLFKIKYEGLIKKQHSNIINYLNNNNIEAFITYTEDNQEFRAGKAFHPSRPPCIIDMVIHESNLEKINPLLEKMSEHPYFYSYYIMNYRYFKAQNATSIDEVNSLNGNTKGFKIIRNETNDRVIDFKSNPSYAYTIENSWIVPAWIMCFGEKFFTNVLSIDKMVKFDKYYEIITISSNKLLVKLYQDLNRPNTKKNQSLQRLFSRFVKENLD